MNTIVMSIKYLSVSQDIGVEFCLLQIKNLSIMIKRINRPSLMLIMVSWPEINLDAI